MKNSDTSNESKLALPNVTDTRPVDKIQQQRVMMVAALMATGITEAEAVQVIFESGARQH
ncbi:hypothetical protein SIN8267_02239 [Sinobacterium norvegicum]|uniref:Uncharacterized protein n=1 Tax=Sinobacterium norvegicum TaxID=1641715 RepID=A0ABM9AGK7_9GAMM|nr:hypothetical protein [Sinobacterium norvegicum]CAH0992123.1 hypothetical protein SIN8267_02239 [Sinobacterium norvegicum]